MPLFMTLICQKSLEFLKEKSQLQRDGLQLQTNSSQLYCTVIVNELIPPSCVHL